MFGFVILNGHRRGSPGRPDQESAPRRAAGVPPLNERASALDTMEPGASFARGGDARNRDTRPAFRPDLCRSIPRAHR